MKRSVFGICVITVLSAAAIAVSLPAPSLADKAQNSLAPQRQSSLEFPAGVSTVDIPVRTINGSIVVRVQIGTHALDFAFDSGASYTVVNTDVFRSLGIASGPNATSAVTTLQIGDLKLHDVNVTANPMEFHPFEDTKIVGLIGYDLLKSAAVRLDYEQGTLDVTKPDGFVAPASSFAIPIQANAAVPVVQASVGGAKGSQFIVDTGAYTIVVLPHFTEAHPELFNDSTRRHDVGENQYVSRLQPVCGVDKVIPYGVSDFQLGDVELPNWLVLAHERSGCFAMRLSAVDGLIGYDFLRLFTVTFDMPASRIYLEPRQPK